MNLVHWINRAWLANAIGSMQTYLEVGPGLARIRNAGYRIWASRFVFDVIARQITTVLDWAVNEVSELTSDRGGGRTNWAGDTKKYESKP